MTWAALLRELKRKIEAEHGDQPATIVTSDGQWHRIEKLGFTSIEGTSVPAFYMEKPRL